MEKIMLAENITLEFDDGVQARAMGNGGHCVSYVLCIQHADSTTTKLYTHIHVGGKSMEPYVRVRAIDMIEDSADKAQPTYIARSVNERYAE